MTYLSVSKRTGMVLLEVIVSVTILALSALSVLMLAAEATDAVGRAEASAEELQRASNFLNEVALWPRADLDRHLGDRSEGPWLLRIDHPSPALYVVSLRNPSSAPSLLSTSLYRTVDASNP